MADGVMVCRKSPTVLPIGAQAISKEKTYVS